MNIDQRLAVLSKLIDNKAAGVQQRLSEEFSRAEKTLSESPEYDELMGSLKVVAVLAQKFHGAVISLLSEFVKTVSSRALTYAGEPIPETLRNYRSAGKLVIEAIESSMAVRYLYPENLADFLLNLTASEDQEVRKKAKEKFEGLLKYDINVFYGEHGLGANPQARIISHLKNSDDVVLGKYFETICAALSNALSPSMEGHSWSYNSVEISRRSIMDDGEISEIRANAIALLIRIYSLSQTAENRIIVLNALNSAMRRERPAVDAKTSEMFERDAVEVLKFLLALVTTEELPIIQKIEHQVFWNYYHAATPAVEEAALQVRDVLAENEEYQIYKMLIGFEGIFGPWEELRRSQASWDYSDTKRKEAIGQYLEQIDASGYTLWRDRILQYSKTRSTDLATFPIYYQFLERVGRERSPLALELVTKYTNEMSQFISPLLRGLWNSNQAKEVESLVNQWLDEGIFLNEIAKSLYEVGGTRLHILEKIIQCSVERSVLDPVFQTLGVAASLYADGCEAAKAVFMTAMRLLSKHREAGWANFPWFSRDLRKLFDSLDEHERLEVLRSLDDLPQLHYQAEELLSSLAEKDTQAVLDYLLRRLKRARDSSRRDSNDARFEAIPFDLNKLNKQLSLAPQLLLNALRQDFSEESRSLFTYRGARLIKSTFPEFDSPIEDLLSKFVESGNTDDIYFVLSILRTYQGAPAIFGLCKSIVLVTEEDSDMWGEVESCIESTGVVSGEYGMAEAYEKKKELILPWLQDAEPKVNNFAKKIIANLEHSIARERKIADQELMLRKHRYQ